MVRLSSCEPVKAAPVWQTKSVEKSYTALTDRTVLADNSQKNPTPTSTYARFPSLARKLHHARCHLQVRRVKSCFSLSSGLLFFGVMRMKTIFATAAVFLATFAQPVLAGCNDPTSFLSQSQINTLLSSRFACGRSTSQNAPGWNELHQGGGALIEQHTGGATVENVGTWNTAIVSGNTNTGVGRVNYSYAGGIGYRIASTVTLPNGNAISCNGNATCTNTGTYQFCGFAPAPALLTILISATAPSLASCPSNP